MVTPAPPADGPPSGPGLAVDWWEDDPATAARHDRAYYNDLYNRDEDS